MNHTQHKNLTKLKTLVMGLACLGLAWVLTACQTTGGTTKPATPEAGSPTMATPVDAKTTGPSTTGAKTTNSTPTGGKTGGTSSSATRTTGSAAIAPASAATGNPSDPQAAANARVVPVVKGLPPEPGAAAIPRIGVGDLIQITVFMAPELSVKRRVTASGDIFMPLVGAIQVQGLTQEDAQQLITRKLARDYLQNPIVNVFVEESATQNVVVNGEVEAAGEFPIYGQMTLMQAIALARGAMRTAKNDVIIFRSLNQDQVTAYIVDLEQIQDGTLNDPPLVGGDIVHVVRSGTTVLFDRILGFVRFGAIPIGT